MPTDPKPDPEAKAGAKPEKAKSLPKYLVTGPAPVTGADGDQVPPGGLVVLDPDVVNVYALLISGAVAVPGTPADPTVKPAKE